MQGSVVLLGFDQLDNKDLENILEDLEIIRISYRNDSNIDRFRGAQATINSNLSDNYKNYFKSKIDKNFKKFFESDFYKFYLNRAYLASGRGVYNNFNYINGQTCLEINNSILAYVYGELFFSNYKKIKLCICAYPPHSTIDWALYYIMRFLEINVISFSSLPNSNLSLVYKNLLDDLDSQVLPEPLKILNKSDHLIEKAQYNFANAYTAGNFKSPAFLKIAINKFPKTGININFILLCYELYLNLLKYVIKSFLGKFTPFLDIPKNKPSPSPYYIHNLFIRRIKVIFSNFTERVKTTKINNLLTICPYVYMPLHFQPESSTETMGGFFVDQLLFAKFIRDIIPKNWKIIFKRPPLDLTPRPYLRHKGFWDFLKNIENSLIIDNQTKSEDLIKLSKLVASPTGTSNFEANLLGIPSIYGGFSNFAASPIACQIKELNTKNDFNLWYEKVSKNNLAERYNQMTKFINQIEYKSIPGKFYKIGEFSKLEKKETLSHLNIVFNSLKNQFLL